MRVTYGGVDTVESQKLKGENEAFHCEWESGSTDEYWNMAIGFGNMGGHYLSWKKMFLFLFDCLWQIELDMIEEWLREWKVNFAVHILYVDNSLNLGRAPIRTIAKMKEAEFLKQFGLKDDRTCVCW